MDDTSIFSSISVAIDLFGAAISIIILFFLLMGDNRKIRLNHLFSNVVLCTIAILILDAISWAMDGTTEPYSGVVTKTASLLGYIFMHLIIGAFTLYLKGFLEAKTTVCKPLIRIALLLCAVSALAVVLSQFNGMYYYFDESNYYHRGNLYLLSQALVFVGLLLNAAIVFVHRKALTRKEFASFMSYLGLPILLNVLHIRYYEISWSCAAITLAVIIIYAGIQSDQAKRLLEQELELADSRAAIMLSQIQPHFLYNALLSVERLCARDPEEARRAIMDFSVYLQGNMESLSRKAPIAFARELEHVKTYLALEQRRFRDRLRVEYRIDEGNFMLPALTLQPIVENAVRHGVTKREKGGCILIHAWEEPTDYLVAVTDDGVGFDPLNSPGDGDSHIGIENVRIRLMAMCGGTVEFDSAPGKGTAVTIRIPKEGS